MALLSMGMTWASFAQADSNACGWRLAASRSRAKRRLCGAAHARGYSQEMSFAMRQLAGQARDDSCLRFGSRPRNNSRSLLTGPASLHKVRPTVAVEPFLGPNVFILYCIVRNEISSTRF